MSELEEINELTNYGDPVVEPSSFRLVSTLGIAGFLAGLVLVGTYIYTAPIIEANKAEALQSAIFKVLAEGESFEELLLIDGKLLANSDNIKLKAGDEVKKIYMGFNKDKDFIGFAIPGKEPGYQDIIGVIYGYDPAQKIIIGFQVLESKETPGLGDKIFKDAAFQENFKALSVIPDIEIVKNGLKNKSNEVEAITGATISSKAIVRLLNKSMMEWSDAINDYIENNNIEVVISQ